jgi:REP element-mobilizing transposase RayT
MRPQKPKSLDKEKSSKKAETPGGTGFQPVQSFQITRRNLPHWQEQGRVYFLTWRCKQGRTLNPEDRTIVMEALRHWDDSKWKIYTAVVLKDHVHVLARTLSKCEEGVFDLGEILHSVKSFSSQKINRLGGYSGVLWQDERYDRIVREEREFLETWEYIRDNPSKEGWDLEPEEYPWFYERGV